MAEARVTNSDGILFSVGEQDAKMKAANKTAMTFFVFIITYLLHGSAQRFALLECTCVGRGISVSLSVIPPRER